MKIKKQHLPLVGILLIILVLGAFVLMALNNRAENMLANSSNSNIVTSRSALWKDHFDSMKEMADTSNIIVQGNVVDSYPVQIADLIFTKQVVEVTKVYKGDVTASDKIEILQSGGELNGIKTPPFDEDPLLTEGQYMFFLEHAQEGYYLVLGGIQGIGQIDGDEITFNPNNKEITQEFSSSKSDSMSINSNPSGCQLSDVENYLAEQGFTVFQ